MSTLNESLQTLNQQWYNAVVSGLSLDQKKFQLMQGNCSIGTNSQMIWNFLDAIPPISINNYFDPNGYNSFAQGYGSVINNLKPQCSQDMETLLGDSYSDWTTYNKDSNNMPNPLPTLPDGTLDTTKIEIIKFQKWAISSGIDNNVIDGGVTLLQQKDAVTVAVNMFISANKQYAYTATYSNFQDQINKGVPKEVQMNSSSYNSNISNSWANSSASGGYGFFSASASANWQHYTELITQQNINIDVKFKKVATIPGQPYMTKTTLDTSLSKYSPWFYGPALQLAKQNNNNNVWKYTAPTWADAFGPNGNLVRLNSGLIVVDGIDIEMTIDTKDSSIDNTDFQAAVKGGYWPFFTAEGNGGWTNKTQTNNDGTVTIKSSKVEGNPSVLGVIVDLIENVF